MAAAAAALLLSAAPVAAQAPTAADAAGPRLRVEGQVRPRYEARAPEGTDDEGYTSMRVRLGAAASVAPRVSAFVQLQDVRLWGEEASTLADYSADHLDVHQAWVRAGVAALNATVGRQEVALGEERLVGAVGWAQQGRAFDGVRAHGARGDVALDLLAFRTGEVSAGRPDGSLLGAWAAWTPAPGQEVDAFALRIHEGPDPRAAAPLATVTRQATLGARWAAAAGPFVGRIEGAWQSGTRRSLDVSAWMLAFRAGVRFAEGRGSGDVALDVLSGDDEPGDDTVRVFDTLFATNHKFYGFADLFTDIPVHTGGRGLRDAHAGVQWRLPSDVTVAARAHAFRAAAAEGLPSTRFGRELDVTGAWVAAPGLILSAGAARFEAGPALAAVGRDVGSITWAFVMLDATF